MSSNFIPFDEGIYQYPISIFNTSDATSSYASLMINGGVTIFNTQPAINFNSGGGLLILGGSAIQGNTIIGGVTQILDTTETTNTASGALQIRGGLAIQKNLFGSFSNFNSLQINTNASITNLINTNLFSLNTTTTNLLVQNISTTSLQVNNSTITNNFITNETVTNSLMTNTSISNLRTVNDIITNLTATNSIITNNIITNLTTTNSRITNDIITNLTTTNSNITNSIITTLTNTNSLITNTTITSLIGTNLNTTNLTAGTIRSTNITTVNLSTTNLTVTTSGTIAGIGLDYYTGTSGSWINMPVGNTFLSGIGNGGPGVNPWIAYAGSGGNWFTNSTIGDLCYRNINGKLLFGNSGSLPSTLSISNNFVNINSTIESINTTTGSLVVNGGIGTGKAIQIGSTFQSTNNSTGALISNGGAGFNGPVYARDFYTYLNGTTPSIPLTPSPVTTKGDIFVWSTDNDRLPIGTNNRTLVPNSATSTGLEWVNPLTQPGFYGSEFQNVSDFNTVGTTSATGVLRTSMTTSSLVGGIYNINMQFSITPTTSTNTDLEIGVYLDTNSVSGFNTGFTTTNLLFYTLTRQNRANYHIPYSFNSIKTFSPSTIHSLGMYFRRATGSIVLGKVSLTIYRIQ